MKPIYDAWLIQIEVTNGCIHDCAHCTRGMRLVNKPFFADLGHIEKALISLNGWRGGVGCMGGEPTLHPKFPEICDLYKKYFPKNRIGLWTAGGSNYKKYKDLILDTFGIINFNDHFVPSFHQPVLVASEDVVEDSILREKLIDNCWLQRTWSPTITSRGAFFCEVAATIDLLFNGSGGYPIEPGWWRKNVKQFKDQRDLYCKHCGLAVPMHNYPDNYQFEVVSPKNYELLHTNGCPEELLRKVEIFDKKLTLNDIKETLRSRKRRDPSKYALPDKEHFWVRNSMEFYQKKKSFVHTIKAKMFEFWLKYLA